MKIREHVFGGPEKPKELQIDVDTVYRRSNFEEYTDAEGATGWRYSEEEIPLIEYFRDSVPENQEIVDKTLGELSIVIAEYQAQNDEAIAELSMLVGEVLSNVQ